MNYYYKFLDKNQNWCSVVIAQTGSEEYTTVSIHGNIDHVQMLMDMADGNKYFSFGSSHKFGKYYKYGIF